MSLLAADFWEEHCTECGAPACYRECPMFERSEIGRCRRFDGGLRKVRRGLPGDAFEVRFRPWGKLEMDFHGRLTTQLRFNLLRRFDAVAGAFARFGARLTPRFVPYWRNPWGLYRSFRWRLVRLMSKTVSSPSTWSVCVSSVRPVNLVVSLARGDQSEVWRGSLPVTETVTTHVFRLPPVVGEALYRIFAASDADCAVAVTFHRLALIGPSPAQPFRPAAFVKCLAWDLDGTLWDGTLLEDGADALRLNESAVRLVKELDARGIVNSVVSRNDAAPALDALRRFGLEEYFVFPQIGWRPKSEGLVNLAREMNVGLDALAFVDDREENRAEVRMNAPAVRVFDVAQLDGLSARPEFNPPTSAESAGRRATYRAEMVRRATQSAAGVDAEAFARLSGLRVTLTPVVGAEDPLAVRCRELVQRTNRLTLAGRRYGEGEFAELLRTNACFAVGCRDKYGDYGTVGFACVSNGELREFVMSCRVAGRGCERRTVEALKERTGVSSLWAKVEDTGRNDAVREALAGIVRLEESET